MPADWRGFAKVNIIKWLILIDFIVSYFFVREKLTLAIEASRQLFNNGMLFIGRFVITMPQKHKTDEYHGQAQPLAHA